MKHLSNWAVALSIAFAIALPLSAEAMGISYQGFLTDAGGNPINGIRNFQFTIYDSSVAGAVVLGPQFHGNVNVANGIFEAMIEVGAGADLVIDKNWLGTRVAVPGNPFDPELTPRTRLGGAPYCFKALYVDRPLPDGDWLHNGDDMYSGVPGNIGIGFSNPAEKLHVAGNGPAKLLLEADRDNSGESDNAAVRFSQDGGAVVGRVGYRDGRNQMEFVSEFADQLLFGNSNLFQMVLTTGGALQIRDASVDFTSVQLTPSGTIDKGGEVLVSDHLAHNTFQLDGEHGNGEGSIIIMKEADGTSTVEIDAEDGANSGGVLRVRKGDGTVGVQLDANYSGGLSRVIADVVQITGGADLSENFTVRDATEPGIPSTGSTEGLHQGLVVSIDPDYPGQLRVSDRAYDSRVAGIVSGAGQVRPGMLMAQAGSVANGDRPVALTGRVYCWADASVASIQPGDLLTTSDVPGHAMKAVDLVKAQGAIIGKAMTGLNQGTGLVLVLVNLQ